MNNACRWKKIRIAAAVAAGVILLFGGVLFFALTPYALREILLPAAARSAGGTAKAEKIRLVSLFPFRIKAADFHYTDPDLSIDIAEIVTGLPLGRLKKHLIELHGTRIKGIRIRWFGNANAASSDPAQKNGSSGKSAPDSDPSQPWIFSMKDYTMTDAVFEYENSERKVVQVWTVKSLKGNRFRAGEDCSVTADSTLRIYPDKQNPLEIRNLPFRIQADYRLDSAFRLKSFSLDLKTGICDFSIPNVIQVPAGAGIRASVRMSGLFPDPETFRIASSEIRFFKGYEEIGKLQVKGESGRRFQYDGVVTDMDLQPYLRLLAPSSQVNMKLSRADFAVTGSDFSPEGIRKDLKARVIARLDHLSIPIELNHNSRLMRMVMIPIEALPSFVELIGLKWDLHHEFTHCLNSIQAVVSGRQNLDFDLAKLDLSMENNILMIRNFLLQGKEIEMESIRGTLDLTTEKLDIRTVLIIKSVKLPLQFKGTLSKPSPHFKEAMKNFVLLNAPLLKKLESLLKEPPSSRDSKLEKAIKRGYRDFHRYIQ